MAEESGARRTRLWLGLVLLVTGLAYAPCLGFDFVYDDQGIIVDNPGIRNWSTWTQDFTTHLWDSVFPGSKGSQYRPVFTLWLRLNDSAFGLAPWGWHLSNLLVHLVVTALAFALARRVLQEDAIAGLAALVFGLHPVHAESVAWVSAAADPLMAAFGIGAVLAASRSWETSGNRATTWRVLSYGSYALALLSKEVAVALPGLLLLQLWIEGERRLRVLALRLAPFAVLALLYLAIRRGVLGGVGLEQSPLSLVEWALTLPLVLAHYGARLLWPLDLAAFFELPPVTPSQASRLVAPLLGLAGAAAGLVFWRRRSDDPRLLGLGLAWLVVPLSPMLVLPLLPRGEFVHERYLYLPALGFALLVAAALRQFCGERRRLLIGVGAVLTFALAAALIVECRPWRSNLALFQRAVAVEPDNAMAWNNLGLELDKRGRRPEAIVAYESAIARDPDLALAHFNLGMIAYRQGRREEARRRVERAVALNPQDPEGFVLLAVIHNALGSHREALEAADRALALRPGGHGYNYLRGRILVGLGRLDQAVAAYELELRLRPGFPPALKSLGELRARLERGEGERPSGD